MQPGLARRVSRSTSTVSSGQSRISREGFPAARTAAVHWRCGRDSPALAARVSPQPEQPLCIGAADALNDIAVETRALERVEAELGVPERVVRAVHHTVGPEEGERRAQRGGPDADRGG